MGRIVVDLLRNHRADDSELVGMSRDVWEEAGNLDATLAMSCELSKWSACEEGGVLQLCELLAIGE